MEKKFSKKKIFYLITILSIFLLDRVLKIYILNLAESSEIVDVYLNSFLNLYLIWNTGVGFGLFSTDQNLTYNIITVLIIFINFFILFMVIKYKDYRVFFLILILGGSLGNLFDRIYYKAVPDFIDLHYESFHWFVFNVADIFITLGVTCLILGEIFFNKDLKK